jgi:MraZ protein
VFTWEYRHSLDQKGRLVLPSEWRQAVAEGAVITQSQVGGYLVGQTRSGFEAWMESVREAAKDDRRRMVERTFFRRSKIVDLDTAGRILLPVEHRNHAGIGTEAVLIGVGERFEVWDPAS